MNLPPKQIVAELDRYIIGQNDAKRAVAVALRNRYRRAQLPEDVRDEITPKNIILKGPTGVGKTEIARRLAKLVRAPFIKVEATKFTEVGYVGRDVESMIRDLAEMSVRIVKDEKMAEVEVNARKTAENKIVDILYPIKKAQHKGSEIPDKVQKENILKDLKAGKEDNTIVEIDLKTVQRPQEIMPGMGMAIDLNDMMGGLGGLFGGNKSKKRKVSVKEALAALIIEESDKLLDKESINAEAVRRAEQEGIIFIDEIDKIASKGKGSGPDVSREGVQRDILPIVEGCTVNTKYGPIKTDFILFIASGAFHIAKMSDLIPELQGRFPIKVELKSLTVDDFSKILTQPENSITKQYTYLLAVDHINIKFKDDAIAELSNIAVLENNINEDIGARRLHSILENLLEDISFNASGDHPDIEVVIDKKYVLEHLKKNAKKQDLKKYIL